MGSGRTWVTRKIAVGFGMHGTLDLNALLLMRLVRKTIGFSKSEEMHDKVIGTYIEREFYW